MHSVRPQDQQKSLMRLLSSTDMKTFCKRWSSKLRLDKIAWEPLVTTSENVKQLVLGVGGPAEV